ncbi:recombinase RecT [Mesorhizobium sp. CA14]|uniref:recombinase RecT n=1 Tax=Mesorhizobium sp. CA14 TaxID=2876642 RepID=UPI001CCFEF9F|nr:recombinase RecT [Mesorhizobium sp. CA14]MBZ9847178.1 recombinase RecT [Mesorhizobium sp. CA14]
MTTVNNAVVVAQPQAHRAISVFSSEADFTSGQRLCKALTSSNLVPVNYRGEENMGNALVALDMANRMGIPPIMVMQNLNVIEGRPSWASQFVIGALNSCGLFSPIRFRKVKLGEQEVSYERWAGPKGNRSKETVKAKVFNIECTAYAVEKATGETLEGPTVSIAMAVAEGWYFRPGSKWVTMPDLMLMYRAAAFFGRLYAPHILNGMPSADEVADLMDMRDITPAAAEPVAAAETPAAKPKPAGRPRGVHAAMTAAKEAEKAKEKKPAGPVIEAEAEEIPHDEDGVILEDDPDGDAERGAGADDVFGVDEDDDEFNPA